MNHETFWKALLDYGTLETSELKTWMRHMESVWRIHGCFPEMNKVRSSEQKVNPDE